MVRVFGSLILALASLSAFGAGNDLAVEQRRADDSAWDRRNIGTPTANAIYSFDFATTRPAMVTLSPSLQISSGILGLAFTPFSGNFSDLLSKPTTLVGYGITDAYPLSGNPSSFLTSSALTPYLTSATAASTYATQSSVTSGLSAKFNTPAGTTSQVVLGNGTLGALPTTVTPTINDNPGRSLVTATNATGFQISATRQTKGCYEGSISTTSTIGGPASASLFLETAATNSTTPGDWTIRARQTYSNAITLAVVLNQVQSNNWTLCRDFAPGAWVRIRVGNVTGTASAAINTEQQEVTY